MPAIVVSMCANCDELERAEANEVQKRNDRKAIALWRLANTVRFTTVVPAKSLGQEYAAQTADQAAIALAGPNGYDRIKREYGVDLDAETFRQDDAAVLEEEYRKT